MIAIQQPTPAGPLAAPAHTPLAGVRAPTDEQEEAIAAVARGDNVTLSACAGAGKTFTMLAIVARLNREAMGKKILILTYSSSLKTDTRKRAFAQGLAVDVHSFHSLYSVVTDLQLMVAIEDPLDTHYDVVIVDEAQDLSPLYFYTLRSVASQAGRHTQKVLVGDSLQTINQYRGASDTYFCQPELYFNEPWTHLTLSRSFRVPDTVCKFINTSTQSPNVITGTGSSRLPEYVVYGDAAYPEQDLYRDLKLTIAAALRSGKSVFVLAPSVRNKSYRSVYNGSGRHTAHSFKHNSPRPSPISTFISYLVRSPDFRYPIDVPSDDMTVRNSDDEDSGDDDDDSPAPPPSVDQRVVFKTYHGSKGLEADLVICFGYDMSYFSFYARDADPLKVPNTHHVGLTRTKNRIIMLHNTKHAMLPYLNRDAMLCSILASNPLDLRPASEALCSHGQDDGPPRPKLITQAAQLLGEDIDFCIALFKSISLSDVIAVGAKRVNMWAEDIVAVNNTHENVSAIKDMAIMLMLDATYASRAHSYKSGMGMGNVMSVLMNGSASSSMNQKWLEAWELIHPRTGPLQSMSMSKKAFVCALVLSSHSFIHYANQVPILDRFVTHVSWKRIRAFFETFNMASPQFNFPLRFEDERYVVKMAIPVIDHAKHIAVNLYVRGDVSKERIIETTIMNDILIGNGFVEYRLYTASLESQEYYEHDGCASGFFGYMAKKNSLDAILEDRENMAMAVDVKTE